MATLEIGDFAPGFSLRGIDGKIYALNQHGARLTLAVFFKTTCPTCMIAFPYFEKIHQQFRDAGLSVWGVSQDARDDSAEFVRAHNATFTILTDADLRVSREYDPAFVPTTFLINPAGSIVDVITSFDKAGLNRIAQTIATRMNVAPTLIAPENDGNPVFKLG